jgi:hypothetical protein
MRTKVKLKIAGVIIEMRSDFPLKELTGKEKMLQASERFDNFFYGGSQKPHIRIKVDVVDKLPQTGEAEPVFITYHFQNGAENWRLLKKGEKYIYKTDLSDKKQLMIVNKNFERVNAYLLLKEDGKRGWNISDIIYDFLQVLLINYFGLNKSGIFVHGIGVKDLDGRGFLFAGKSGAGKSTTARIWHKNSKAMVLNDDRIIVRKVKNKFFIYGSPWHGEFSDYLSSRIESAPIERLFFIYHAPVNRAERISGRKAFNCLFPAIFPAFWDKKFLENIVGLSIDLIGGVACYSLGFLNDKRVIEFTRKIE